MEFHSARLENGLDIVAECNPEAYSTAIGFFVNTGARDETADVAGVSHFLEHMAFKGTATRSADDVNREFDEMGAQCNAYTSEENTVFFAAVLPEHQSRVVGLLADMLRPALREDDFATEKLVILEEIHMYEDHPPFGAEEKCRAAFFGEHPLGHSILGTRASIEALWADAMRAYHRRRYGPENVVLVGAGRVRFDALVDDARRSCGRWERAADGRMLEMPTCRPGFQTIRKDIATQQYAIQLAQGPAAADADRYAAKLLATILGDDTGSRLFWDFVDPGLAEHASLGHFEYEGAGVFVTYLCCPPELAADNLHRLLDLYRRVERDGVLPAELQQAKNKVGSRIVLSSERPRGRLFAVGGDWLQRREYRSVRDDIDAVEAVGMDDLAAVVAKYPLSRSATVAIGPLDAVRPPA
jgi:predicted Zn-dependent peptidase